MASNRMNDFEDVGPNDLMPGSMRRVEAHGTFILIANIAGALHAMDDTCTHEEASLYQGALDGDCVRCPLHGSRFCFADGRAIDEPAEIDLTVYPILTLDERLYVGPASAREIAVDEGHST